MLRSPSQWQGYIKDYDGGTLMECLLDHRVPHVDIPQMVRAQRAALDSRIRGLSQSHVVYRGLQHFDEHGRRKHVDIMSIPGASRAQPPMPCLQPLEGAGGLWHLTGHHIVRLAGRTLGSRLHTTT